ncbi:hypothetical protein MNBD_GAMMA18-2065 [hydrothermal vent metagenome]|uniref:COGs COG2929 n=1 Tax=hydrothermal vent metagenome TaxID=652676 RepID=A0A3B0YUK0_9ZZZZ
MMNKFTWHDAKNKTNITKHGVGLKAGITVFEDELRIERYDDANSDTYEDRYITIGKDHRTKVLFVSYTMRNSDNTIHLISVRKAEPHEIRLYEKNSRW